MSPYMWFVEPLRLSVARCCPCIVGLTSIRTQLSKDLIVPGPTWWDLLVRDLIGGTQLPCSGCVRGLNTFIFLLPTSKVWGRTIYITNNNRLYICVVVYQCK